MSGQEGTPTTEEVRSVFAGYLFLDEVGPPVAAAFDRWLAAHSRAVAAAAWDAAVRSMKHEDGTPVEIVSAHNPYRKEAGA